jgi:serine/threonine protein phosphatase 1
MTARTIVIGDVHGELAHLERLWSLLPALGTEDTLVFLGDYIDRGPDSRGVVAFLRGLPRSTPAKLVLLRGNHEDAWLQVVEKGFPEFILPAPNGCWPCARSFLGRPVDAEHPDGNDLKAMLEGSFFPADVVEWMKAMPFHYEDDHAIYVHAGLPEEEGRFLHPSEVKNSQVLLWLRSREFFERYRGKRVICGHTATEDLPALSEYTPDDPADLWYTKHVVAIDTKCGKTGGFLTAVELPSLHVYESR